MSRPMELKAQDLKSQWLYFEAYISLEDEKEFVGSTVVENHNKFSSFSIF